MKVKIISDGNPYGSAVVNAETGEPIEWVSRVEIVITPGDCPHAVITVVNPELEIVGEGHTKRDQTLAYDPDDNDSITQAIARLIARRAERETQ